MDERYVTVSAVEGKEKLGLSRREVLKIGAFSAIGAVGMGLAGCGDSANAANAATTPVARFKTVQDPSKIWTRSTLPVQLLDTQAIKDEMTKARALAGDDDYFLTLQRLLCADFDDTYTICKSPGANVIPADSQSTGRKEVAAEPTKVFDNVYYVGGMEVGGWVIDTGDGYIMLDASYDYGYDEILIPNMQKLGLEPSKVKYILVTHAGPDHVGACKKFQDNFGTKVIFNNIIKANPAFLPNPPVTTVMKDGDTLTLGNTTVTMVLTPRNVGGDGFSYFIPVKINGMSHLWATYGNTAITGTLADKATYTASIRNYIDNYVVKLQPDIAISSHPFVDGSLNRMKIIRDGGSGKLNPFLIGVAAAKNYFEIMAQAVTISVMRQQAGLDATGTIKLA